MVLVAGEAMPLAAKASIILTIGGFGVFTTSELPISAWIPLLLARARV